MHPISVVIITRNEAANIGDCIVGARLLTNDIIVVDAGSTDETVPIATSLGARVMNIRWQNFGSSRNAGAALADHDWILALDADERITAVFADRILSLTKPDPQTIYGFHRQSFFEGKRIRFGTWGRDRVFRLYHREVCQWDTLPVHETLFSGTAERVLLTADLVHYPARKEADFTEKICRYAELAAEKYLLQKKSSTFFKRLLSPPFAFFQSYILLLGFLDGKEGLIIARHQAWYTRLKYHKLAELEIRCRLQSFSIDSY